MRAAAVGAVALAVAAVAGFAQTPPSSHAPQFELVQPDLFSAPGGQANAWADFDGDGQLDEFVGFRGRPNRLYRQDRGRFTDVAAAAGVADTVETRVAAWGDYDADGFPDLFIGFAANVRSKIYRNDGHGHFVDVAAELGIDITGVSRQASWIDYDNDGDLDLFAAFRDKPNRLFRNDLSTGGRFTDVTEAAGIGDPRKTVGAVWFDIDGDGDLDLFVANQNGDTNGLFRNDNGRFTDVAREWGVEAPRASQEFGGVGAAVADYDGDGRLDLFVANYGPSVLYRNAGGRFVDTTKEAALVFEGHATTPVWGDYDNDGRPDLYVAKFLVNVTHYRDYLFHSDGGTFHDVLPPLVDQHDASHGVQWVDFDADGALDLALANNDPGGGHYLFRNRLPEPAAHRALLVDVVDARGHHTKSGAEVRVYAAGTRRLMASGLVDTGGGYCSQNVMPVHLGVGSASRVDVEVSTMSRGGRALTTRRGVSIGARAPRLEIRT
jgi:penicillin G amidase